MTSADHDLWVITDEVYEHLGFCIYSVYHRGSHE